MRCPVCGDVTQGTFMGLGDVPVFCNVLWPSRRAALEAPRGSIQLAFCEHCGMIWNAAFDSSLIGYTAGYENSLHFSGTFQAYAEQLADRLIERYEIRDKEVVEIGSGKGEFLALLCARGGNRGTGFDPSYEEGANGRFEDAVRVVAEEYSAERSPPADLVVCRHVLEHIENPRAFLADVRKAVSSRTGAVAYFEVPAAEYMLDRFSIWDVIYEHPLVFGTAALSRLFRGAGFQVLEQGRSFGGQYLWVDVMADGTRTNGDADRGASALRPLVESFAGEARRKIERSDRLLRRLLERGAVVLWGCGSKGVTFLNLVPAAAQLAYVIDINPRKQGRFVAGTGQKVVAPAELERLDPAAILVMNPLYEGEIREAIVAMGLAAEALAV